MHPWRTPAVPRVQKTSMLQSERFGAQALHSNCLTYRARRTQLLCLRRASLNNRLVKSSCRQQCIIIGLLNFHLSQFFPSSSARVTRGFRFLFGRPFCSALLSSQCARHSCVGARGRVACALFPNKGTRVQTHFAALLRARLAYTGADALQLSPRTTAGNVCGRWNTSIVSLC